MIKYISSAIFAVGAIYVLRYWLMPSFVQYDLDVGQALLIASAALHLIWGDK